MTTISNIFMEQGSDFQRTIILSAGGQPVLSSGWSANASMLVDTFANSQISPLYNFNSIVSNSQITISMPANTTSTIAPGFYSYDVVIYNGTQTIRVEEGTIQVTGGISGVK